MKNLFIVILYGPPGSGKGTQAEELVRQFGLKHFNTGEVIEQIVHNPARQDEPIIQRERELFEAGILCTPEWVTEMVKKAIQDLRRQNQGIVFTGSPRTLYEAEKLMPLLEKLYGQDRIFVLKINVKPKTSIWRNSHRKICDKCGQTIVYSSETADLKRCLSCGGVLRDRGRLDKPETIKKRLQEYQERTVPIFDYLKEKDYKIIEIDGEPLPEEVTKNLLKILTAKTVTL